MNVVESISTVMSMPDGCLLVIGAPASTRARGTEKLTVLEDGKTFTVVLTFVR
jgi:hypothetical protein